MSRIDSIKKKKVTCVDLFCGAGGLTHGLMQGGVRVLLGIDTDPQCQFPYEANNKGARFLNKDVSQITSKELNEVFEPGSLKLLAGCAPCQPFSTYSHRYDTKRNNKWALLYEFERLVKETKPDLVTMENVPAVIKHKVFKEFVTSLKNRKYHIWYDVVECKNYGVPQSRKRIVLLAVVSCVLDGVEVPCQWR